MFCKICGATLTGSETVCPNCGAPVENVVTTTETEILQPAQPTVEQAPVMEPTPVAIQPVEQAPVVEPTPVAIPPVEQAPVMEPTPVAIPPVEQAPVVEPTPVVIPPVEQTPVVEPTPVVIPPVEQTPVMEPTPVEQPVVQQPTGFVEPAVAAMQPQTAAPLEATTPKKDKKTIILVIALAVVAALAVVIYFTVLAPANEPEAPTPNNGDNSGTPTTTETEKTENYAGYTFTIPEGYTATTDSEYGLMITNKELTFTIAADYSHAYDSYKTSLSAKYPDQKDKLVATVEGREYLALILTDTDGSQGTQYVTKADDKTTFVGMVVKSDYAAPTTVEFTKLTEILGEAKKGTESINPGDDSDAGKTGEKIYTFTKNKFSFEEKGE